ncbi:hypothetical protein L9F63_002565, partial [Diploptera punctata]
KPCAFPAPATNGICATSCLNLDELTSLTKTVLNYSQFSKEKSDVPKRYLDVLNFKEYLPQEQDQEEDPKIDGRMTHHHVHHWGPFFEEERNNSTNGGQLVFQAPLGESVYLNCRVAMLQDKTVMWLRRNADRVSLLTVGASPYTSDPRLKVKFQYPNNWRLHISPVQREDEGVYMCQVSTHPPRVLTTNLTVLAPELKVVDEHGHSVHDRYYKTGSTIELTCRVTTSVSQTSPQVTWTKNGSRLPGKVKLTPVSSLFEFQHNEIVNNTAPIEETTSKFRHFSEMGLFSGVMYNGNFSSCIEPVGGATVSRVVIPRAAKSDSGMYTCSISKYSSVVVHVHVLNGEKQAAVQHDTWGSIVLINNRVLLWTKTTENLGRVGVKLSAFAPRSLLPGNVTLQQQL